MLKNYIKIAVRNLIRYKAYSYINISGLAIGIACCLLILLYINDEISYDSFHEKADRIYRINTSMKYGAFEMEAPLTSDMTGPTMKKDFPQVEEYTRIYTFSGGKMIKKGNEYNNEQKAAFVDSTFFYVFTFRVLSGSEVNALNEPNSVVITKSVAEKYFGTVNAAGKFLETNENGNNLYKVTCVIEDMPYNSHFRFDFLFPMANTYYCCWKNFIAANFYTYFLLKEGVNYKEFEKNFNEYSNKYVFPFAKEFMGIQSREEFTKAGNNYELYLIPLTDIHFYSNKAFELSPGGTIQSSLRDSRSGFVWRPLTRP